MDVARKQKSDPDAKTTTLHVYLDEEHTALVNAILAKVKVRLSRVDVVKACLDMMGPRLLARPELLVHGLDAEPGSAPEMTTGTFERSLAASPAAPEKEDTPPATRAALIEFAMDGPKKRAPGKLSEAAKIAAAAAAAAALKARERGK